MISPKIHLLAMILHKEDDNVYFIVILLCIEIISLKSTNFVNLTVLIATFIVCYKFDFIELQAELKGYSRDNYSRLDEMKERADTLRSAREEKRKNVSL